MDGDTCLAESPVITDYIARKYPDNGTPLLPSDPAAQAKVRLLIKYFEDHVLPAYHRLVRVEDEQAVKEATEELVRALKGVDEFLTMHGAGSGEHAVGPRYNWSMHSLDEAPSSEQLQNQYFLGPSYSLAEVALTPWVARMIEVLPDWRGVDVMQLAADQKLNRLISWMKACMDRPSAKMTDPTSEALIQGLVDWQWSHAIQ